LKKSEQLILALAVLAGVALSVLGLSVVLRDGASSQQPPGPPVAIYQGVPLDATLLRLDKRALDEAYHAQMLKLFGVWLASGAPGEATNFINGLRIARRAYTQAAAQIARRETELLEQERERQQQQDRQQQDRRPEEPNK
jgi:hypothetical protein